MKHINIPVFIPQLGCPFQCIFCQQSRISHAGPVPMPSQVAAIIKNCLQTVNIDQSHVEAAFFGGSFTALSESRQRAYLQAIRPFLDSGMVQSIRISTRPDCIDDAILDLLKSGGVETIELGVQSFNDSVLEQCRRGYKAGQVVEACRLIKDRGFKLGIQLMIGLPGDNLELALTSTRTAIEQSPDMIRIYPTLVITGTVLEAMYRNGLYKPLNMEEAVEITSKMYMAFQARDIPVIRMGLHPGEELRSPGNIIAGPFHPAFGELVEQAVYKQQAMLLLRKGVQRGRMCSPVLQVNIRELSKMLGWKRRNITDIKESLGLEELKVVGRPEIPRGEIHLLCEEDGSPAMIMNRQDFFKNQGCNQHQSLLESQLSS